MDTDQAQTIVERAFDQNFSLGILVCLVMVQFYVIRLLFLKTIAKESEHIELIKSTQTALVKSTEASTAIYKLVETMHSTLDARMEKAIKAVVNETRANQASQSKTQ